MLTRNSIYDAHIHLPSCPIEELIRLIDFTKSNSYSCMVALNSAIELHKLEVLKAASLMPKYYSLSYGLHPYGYAKDDMAILEKLLARKDIAAIGECGFDLYTKELKATITRQEAAFKAQLELAIYYRKPMILHLRRAISLAFKYSAKLKLLPLVIFHSYSGTALEALSILRHGIKAYFSFGTSVLKGPNKATRTAAALPPKLVLCETDAPYGLKHGPNSPLHIVDSILDIKHKLQALQIAHV